MSEPDVFTRALEAAARAEAAYDGRTFEAMPRRDRERYIDRFHKALGVYRDTYFASDPLPSKPPVQI